MNHITCLVKWISWRIGDTQFFWLLLRRTCRIFISKERPYVRCDMSWKFYHRFMHNCIINPTHALPRVRLNEKLFSIIGLIIWASLVMGFVNMPLMTLDVQRIAYLVMRIVNMPLMTLRILLMFREFISPWSMECLSLVIVLVLFWKDWLTFGVSARIRIINCL